MAWKVVNGMLYEDCEEDKVRGVTDGSVDSRHGRYIDKFSGLP